jgi:hypothetical protein
MELDIELRAALPQEAPSLAAIWRAGWRDAHTGRVPQALIDVPTDASFDDRAAERVADATVAIIGDDVVGFRWSSTTR